MITFNFNQFLDRSYSWNIKKDLEDDNNDDPNTKLETMDELIELYKGSEFEGDAVFSRFGSTLVICLMFCTGMPCMYIVAFIFFFLTYLVNKYMLFNYYLKVTSLDRVIPNVSMPFVTIALYGKMILGIFMLGNTNITKGTRERPPTEYTFLDWFALPGYEGYLPEFYQKLYFIFVVGFFGAKVTSFLAGGVLKLIWMQIVGLFKTLQNQLMGCYKSCKKGCFGNDHSHRVNRRKQV